MSIPVTCRNCAKKMSVPDRYAGTELKCLKCRSPFQVPELTPPSPPQPIVSETRQRPDVPRRVLAVLALAILLIFGWHLYLTREARRIARESSTKATKDGGEVSLSVNPITNMVKLTLILPPPELDPKNPFASLGSRLGRALGAGLGSYAIVGS